MRFFLGALQLIALLTPFSLMVLASQDAAAVTGAADGMAVLNKLYAAGQLSLDNAARTPLRQWANSGDIGIRAAARVLLANLYVDDGNDRIATRLYREIISDPLAEALSQREMAVLGLARIHQRAGEADEALRLLEPMVKGKSADGKNQIEAAYWCAVIYRERGDEAHRQEAVAWAVHAAERRGWCAAKL